jgi:hypothetical protein
VHFGGNKISLFNTGDLFSVRDYLAAELVPRNERRMDAALRPPVPFINMQIGAADGCYFDFDENIGAANDGKLYLPNFCPWRRIRFYYR